MCGIAGFLSKDALGSEAGRLAEAMAATLAHRGPDDAGTWVDAEAGIAFGHRRLAVIDLSAEGHQPMQSPTGRYVINYNGEIYNYAKLQNELRDLGHRFRGHSDTEVMLAAFEQWGIEQALKSLVGMFAFALWDRKERLLILARDRMGEKPLYYGIAGKFFVFASELKALRALPEWKAEVDREALTQLLRFGFIPAPHSIYRGIKKLIPGTFLFLRAADFESIPSPTCYWSPATVAEEAAANPFVGTETEAIDQLEVLLKQSIADQMVADVPLGAFLSGGVDSSTVVALMQAQSSRPVKTFTIGFPEASYNEAQYGSAVAKHLGTDHTELFVAPDKMLAVIERLPAMYDEPFADQSQIPTHLVASLARKHVTVSLSGDGGDELFGGYQRYSRCLSFWRRARWIPMPLRKAAAAGIVSLSAQTWNTLLRPFRSLFSGGIRDDSYGNKALKVAEVLDFSDFNGLYRKMLSHWQHPASVVPGSGEPPTPFTDPLRQGRMRGPMDQMMLLDAVCYLPDDILVKLDRAGMAVSLESRVPFLDHRVVEFAWRLPLSVKIKNGSGKWILKELLKKYVPSHLIERPKQGFAVPIHEWLRGPLRDWAEALLDEGRIKREGYFDPAPIRSKWEEHVAGKRDHQYPIWDVLMFQAWLEATRK